MNVIKKALRLILLVFLFSCVNTNDMTSKKTFYLYHSVEFNMKTSELKISLDDATNRYFNYKFVHDNSIKLSIYMDYIIIYDDNYIFPTTHYNLKTGRYNLSGIWINVYTKDYIKVLIDRGIAGKEPLQIRHVTRDEIL